MNKIQIKVCGITSICQAHDILQRGVDRIGLVFYRKSPRNISIHQAEKIAESLKSGHPLTLVTVDEPLTGLIALYQRIAVRTGRIQLHGTESVEYITALRNCIKNLNLPLPEIVRRISTYQERDFYLPYVDKLLWEHSGNMPGGNGILHAWPQHTFFQPPKRFCIAGGLNAANVFDSLSMTGVEEVDVSGGVESAPGVKSLEKVDLFIAAVQKYVNSKYKCQ